MSANSRSETMSATARPSPQILSELWLDAVSVRGAAWACVTSTSMSPLIKEGDHVLIERVSPGHIRFGDIVVFKVAGSLAVHRALGKRHVNGIAYLREKGDAVLLSTLVPEEDVVGRVRCIRGRGGLKNLTSARGRALQMVIAAQSLAFLVVWRALAFSLARLGQASRIRRCAAIFARFSHLLQSTAVRLARA
jgi:signal peptidase I